MSVSYFGDVAISGRRVETSIPIRPVAPVTYDAALDVWRATRLRDAKAILASPEVFGQASAPGNTDTSVTEAGHGETSVPNRPGRDGRLIDLDPPRHGAVRRVVLNAFRLSGEASFRDLCGHLVARSLGALDGTGATGAEIEQDVTDPYYTRVCAHVLGMEADGWLAWRNRRRSRAAAGDTTEAAQPSRDAEFDMYLLAEIAAALEGRSSGGLSRLVGSVRRDVLRPLDTQELMALLHLIDAATISTAGQATAKAVAYAAYLGDTLHDADDGTFGRIVGESLRLDPPLRAIRRRCLHETLIDGVCVPAGALVEIHVATVNRDPEACEDPHEFDHLGNKRRRHITFGYGPHACLGAGLVRIGSATMIKRLGARDDRQDAECEAPT